MVQQDYYIRHIDGSPVNSEAERKRIIQCLEAAIERRVSEVIQQYQHLCDYFPFALAVCFAFLRAEMILLHLVVQIGT